MFQLFKEHDIEIPYTKYEITLKNYDGRKLTFDGGEVEQVWGCWPEKACRYSAAKSSSIASE